MMKWCNACYHTARSRFNSTCSKFFITFILTFYAPHFTLVKEALIEIGCVVTSLVRWLSRACTVAKRRILGL